MDIASWGRARIIVIISLILITGLGFFVFSMFSAVQRSNQVEESQLRLILDNLQLENRVVFSSIETNMKLEGRKIETDSREIVNLKSGTASLKNLIDVSEKVAVIGIISEDGEEHVIQKRNSLYATYYYQSAADSLAQVVEWGGEEKKEVNDTLVGNRLYSEDLFRMHEKLAPGKLIWRLTTNLPGISTRKGLSASVMAIDPATNKKYIILSFVPFKRLINNSVQEGYKKQEVFIFRKDSLYFNFDGTNDTVGGFDTTKYFIPWKEIPVQKHLAAVTAWQSLGNHDSVATARFKTDGVNYCAAFSPVIVGLDGTYCALVVPSASLPTLFRSRSGLLVLIAFILLLITGIAFAIYYARNFRKVRFVPLTSDEAKRMITNGESDLLEFKSTIRANLHAGKPGKEIELAWLKSVVAFCNTEGGTILIGVNDRGEILGLEADAFQNDDKCLLHVQNLIGEHVGIEYLSYVRFNLLEIGDKKILAVQCAPLKRIMLLKTGGKEQFYVRSGPSSIELPMSKVLEYVNDRKKSF